MNWNTVECPYCEYDNDMSDALTDLPSDDKFDTECEECEEEFEVQVEFSPDFSANKIVYGDCDECGVTVRDACKKGKIFPWPKATEAKVLCLDCFLEKWREDLDSQ